MITIIRLIWYTQSCDCILNSTSTYSSRCGDATVFFSRQPGEACNVPVLIEVKNFLKKMMRRTTEVSGASKQVIRPFLPLLNITQRNFVSYFLYSVSQLVSQSVTHSLTQSLTYLLTHFDSSISLLYTISIPSNKIIKN